MKTILLAVPLLLLAAAPAAAQAPKKPAPAAAPQAPASKTVSFKDGKLAAIEAWLAANKTGADRAEALTEGAQLAFDLGYWARAKGYADVYTKEFATGEQASAMKLLAARSLASTPGSETEAKKAFEKIAADAGDDVHAAVDATTELAMLLVSSGDKDGAKKALEDVGERFGKVGGLKEYLKGKIDEFDVIGSEPKAIEVKTLDGKPVKLADFKGKVLLIDFWATWCGPCVAELPNVIATYKKYHPQGFEILGISLDEDEKKLKDFLGSHEMPWAQFFDGNGWKNEVAVAYGVTSIPCTYLLDRDGKVYRQGLRGPALGREIEKLLASKGAAGTPPAPKR
jgi:thiol-disulfide isomerase/thioredoxin